MWQLIDDPEFHNNFNSPHSYLWYVEVARSRHSIEQKITLQQFLHVRGAADLKDIKMDTMLSQVFLLPSILSAFEFKYGCPDVL